MSYTLTVNGSVTLDPPTTSSPLGLFSTGSLATSIKSFADRVSGSREIDSTELLPFVIQGIGTARFIALRTPDGGSMVALLTSASGIDQAIPFSDMFFLSPPVDDPVTSVSVVGIGRLEWIVAGDP